MSVSGKAAAGKIGTALIAGTYKWEAEQTADMLEATTGADGGFGNRDGGVVDVVVRLNGYFDMSTGAVASILPGTVISDLKLYRNVADLNPAFAFPSAIVSRLTMSAEVRGRIDFSAEIHNKGTYTYADA